MIGRFENKHILAAIFAIGVVIAAAFQFWNVRTTSAELVKSIELTEAQIKQLSQRLVVSNSAATPTLDPAVFWADGIGTGPEQALQRWALDKLREHEQSIRQYVQIPQISAVDDPTVALRMEFTGPLNGVVHFLAETEKNRPALAVSNLQIRPLSQRDQKDGLTMVTTQLTIWGVSAAHDD